jgi:pimeloyl-ACP methyl ester carboxylesterase
MIGCIPLVIVADSSLLHGFGGGSIARFLVMRRPLAFGLAMFLLVGPANADTGSPLPDTALEPCVDVEGASCGTVERLLDPADPSAGTIDIAFEVHHARDTTASPLGTIVAVEGGPGYPSTLSRDFFLDLFDPLLDHRNLLLVDARGTGASGVIDCPELQSYEGDEMLNVALCGAELGSSSDLYGTALAADDMAAVLDALGIGLVDMYGTSYGTFFGQTFALRHPHRLRTLTLDAAYPVEDQDPWYRDLNRSMRDAIRSVCAEDLECSTLPGDPLERVAALADAVRDHPVSGMAYDADGIRRRVAVDAGMLAYLYAAAAYGTTVYEELDAAGRAWMDDGDAAPLLRIAAEQTYWGDAGPVEEFSQGQYTAVVCNDYPQLWDISSPIESRPAQYDASVAELRASDPYAFAPFTVDDWLSSPWVEYDSCINWPAPSTWVAPEPDPAVYPDMPTLVITGELDSLTSPEGNQIVASRFPAATYVEVPNSGHVTALGDYIGCAAGIVVEFVDRGVVGDTSCVDSYPSIRTTDQFPHRLRDVAVGDGDGTLRQRRVATAVAGTVGDLFPRWTAMYGTEGRGLRGGTFITTGLDDVRFRMEGMRWVRDLSVSGTVRWDRTTGDVRATVTYSGSASGSLGIRWNEWEQHAEATASGTIDGTRVRLNIPAP